MPPQNAFLWQCVKNRKNGRNFATTHVKDAEYPSFYLLSIHYISLTAQFFKENQENMFFY